MHGRKALILENVGDHAFPVLHTKEVREHPDLSTSEQGSDGPGRVHQSMGRARSALASRLHAGLTKGETRALIVVASPRALGVIREVYSPTLRNAIHAEFAKDLVKLPVHEIERQLFP